MSQSFQPAAQHKLIVGREREQARLRELLEAALAGRGGTVLIGGEAGIGKSTLVDGLVGEATARGTLVLTGHCYDLTTTPPYGPWSELVDQHSPAPAEARLPTVLQRGDAHATVASQEALFDEAREFFTVLSATRPTVLVLEDLHWADPASLELLRFIVRHVWRLPLLLVVTYRIDEVAPDHPFYPLLPLLIRESGAERIDLRRLTEAEIRELVNRRYQPAATDMDRLASYLLVRTEGNPLYLSELLRTLEEERLLSASPEGWQLGDLSNLIVPPLIRQVILGRVTRLDEPTGQLLTIAAVIGQEAPLELWAAVSGVSDDELLVVVEQAAAANFVTVAENGLAVHFVHALIREALYDAILPLRRRIWHRTIAEALEEAPRPSPDAIAHHFQAAGDARAAIWLIRAAQRAERGYAWTTAAARFEAALPLLEADPDAQRLRGWVLLHLGRLLRYATPARGISHLEAACLVAGEIGDRALAALARAHAGMVRCFVWDTSRGVAEMEEGIAAQDALTASEWADAYCLQRSLLGPLPTDLDFDDARGLEIARLTSQQTGLLVHLLALVTLRYRDAVALGEAYAARIEALDDESLLLHTSTLEGASWIDTYVGLGNAYAALGHVDAAEHAYARADTLYRAAGHHASIVVMAAQHAWLVELPYRPADRAQHARWRTIAEASEQHTEGVYSAGWSPGMMRLPMLVIGGQWAEAREVAENIVEHQPSVLVILAEVALAIIAYAKGDTETVLTIVRRRLPDGPASNPAGTAAIGVFDLARLATAVALDSRDGPMAKNWLEAHDRWLEESDRMLGRAESRLLWARIHALSGEWEQAEEASLGAHAQASSPHQPLALLMAQRSLGKLAARAGRAEDAEQHLAASLDLTDACSAPFERALTLLALAELRAETDRADEALLFMTEARAICESLGALPALAQADALLARLSARPTAIGYPAGLTAREVEVLRLVAQGLTDAEVAEQLFLARRTINTHLTSIYTKLGVSSRAAATRFAVEHGIA